ncbi:MULTISPECIES: shufflon system plasmid conjugative transfer pilus tip adhesin PilV [Enterobacteriaceae]|nr:MULTISPECIES: shufflon system plasmid conjugative transfer pilus tip adhesin PilV [Enterobacteriaceae]EJR7831306.1 shufflon system plasmid conjugative transfer pilus tip adhesin PilV [Salmonella enterica subsp. enterica serovar Orion]HAK7475028.1 shufflon system plasmid conjugative transfer pilus tip adhesin PilV [Salmonella enterica]HDR2614757.1 shufflon system plasmid conjugative transfer pilus tip adhesin PilV [Enterobacter ludwigii]MDT7092993.1 shufflon system plasmid conjugative transfe
MKKHDRGWAMAEFAFVLLVFMVIAGYASGYWQDYIQAKNWRTEAARTGTYAAAARSYIGRNYATLLGASSTTAPTVITTTMLKNTGFLPSGFTETNTRGQKMQTNVIRNAQNPELLQAMVISSGGTPYELKALVTMAKEIRPGFGGYIDDGKTATGALRAWKIPLSAYGASSGNGHIAVLLSTDELTGAMEDSDRLYRFQVNGRPDLNKMHTSIDMGANNINNAGNVNGTNGIFTSEVRGANGNFSVNVTAAGQVKGNTVRADSDISAGRNIAASGNISASGNITASGQVTGGTVRSNKNLSVGGIITLDEIHTANTACPVNGAVSRDASGAILSCQSGLWVLVGSPEGSYATVGSFKGTYSGINTTGKQYRLYVWGGNPPNRKINYGDSDNCVNTYSLIATVGGFTVARDYNGNSTWQKTGNINFDVPNGSTFSIVSNGMMSYGCDYGSFTVLRFQ